MSSSSLATARTYYGEAKKTIQTLSDLAKETNDKFKFEIAMRQYDYIIQASLIHASIENGKIDDAELDFIKEITLYGDVISLFNLKIKNEIKDLPDLSWPNLRPILTTLSLNGKAKFFKKFDTIVGNIADDFVKWFAPIDAKDTATDYLKKLDSALEKIIDLFAKCDGDESEEAIASEKAAAKKTKKSLLIDKWKRLC